MFFCGLLYIFSLFSIDIYAKFIYNEVGTA